MVGVFMKVFMFPGQGSQSKGMGGDLFDDFKDLTQRADDILGYSIKELCLSDPKRELNKTQFTQPALYVVNAFSYLKKIEISGKKPDYVAGHSLGEFNALLAAECFDFDAGLKMVKKRGELMSQAPEGGMAAILNATKEQIESILQEKGLTNIDLANYNTPSQIVISGPIEEIAAAQEFFQKGEMLYYPLNTSGAFHSRIMQPVKDKFESYIKKFKFAAPKIPVISNVTARPYGEDDVVKNLSTQLASGVRWSASIQYLFSLENLSDSMEFEEVGNGEVLTKIFKTIKSETTKSISELAIKDDANELDETPKPEVNIESNQIAAGENSSQKSLIEKNDTNVETKAEEKVYSWNSKYPVGTKVKSTTMDYDLLETRTEAVVLFGHRAAVYVKDYNGYFDLDELAIA